MSDAFGAVILNTQTSDLLSLACRSAPERSKHEARACGRIVKEGEDKEITESEQRLRSGNAQ